MAIGTKTHELRELNDEALAGKLREAKEELFNLRFQQATGQLENHGRMKAVKAYTLSLHDALPDRKSVV